ncbi:MAG: galactose mutarotase [Clostridium sp.]|nr:galactose mutarotase [Clostridium sp.]
MHSISKKIFGYTKNDEKAYLFTMQNSLGMSVAITNFGATIVSAIVPDKNNKKIDVVLGYDDLEKYETQDKYLGATVGRCANRIEDAQIIIDGKSYSLNKNDGRNHLHGGSSGFDKKIWTPSIEDSNNLKFSYKSHDNEEYYPGSLETTVTYSLEDDLNILKIHYEAVSDKDTVCNLTNHSYFNLNGYASGDILEQYVQIFSDFYTENTKEALPDGKICSVVGTPMDFRLPKRIGQDINHSFEQIQFAHGFDNNWVVNNYNKKLQKVASAFSEQSGIRLDVYTDLPGIQFYSGNYLNGSSRGKNNTVIDSRFGFCLECQYFPNAFKHGNFEKPVLKAGEKYDKTIIYSFSIM